MGLETGDEISDLNSNWPLGTDPKSQGDNHIRLIKAVLQNDVWSKSADGGPGDFVAKSGDTMTGRLGLPTGGSAAAPNLWFGGGDIGWHVRSAEDGILGVIGGTIAATIDEAGTTMSGPTSVVTQEKADAAFLSKSGGTLSGPLRIDGGTGASNLTLRFGADTDGMYWTNGTSGGARFVENGVVVASISNDGIPNTAASLMTRGMGDARYARADVSAGGVGTYAMVAWLGSGSVGHNSSNTSNGSNLAFSNADGSYTSMIASGQVWRCMGQSGPPPGGAFPADATCVTLWRRES